MYKIVLYSDERNLLEPIVEVFKEYLPRLSESHFKILKFYSSLELNEFNEQENIADIYFLNISNKNIENSLSIGKRIRQLNPYAFIIYITNINTYLDDYLKILPFAILPKPVSKKQLFALLSTIFKLLKNAELSLLEIKTKKGIVTIDRRLITFVEYENHHLFIHTKNGSIIKSTTIRTSFKKWMEPLLKYESFISPHKSYLINMDYVQKIMNDHTFVMQRQEIIPISNQSFKQIKAKYLKYIKNNYAINNIKKITDHSY